MQEKVPLEIALMWQNMCPAAVYEVPEEELEAARANGSREVEAPDHAVELRAVWGDHREGRPADPPEGGDGPNTRPPEARECCSPAPGLARGLGSG